MKTLNDLASVSNLLEQTDRVILVFQSDVCMDCDYLDTFMDTIVKSFQSITFAAVKRHACPELFKHYQVYGVPSFMFFYQGALKHRLINKERKHPEDVITFIERSLELCSSLNEKEK